MNYFGKMIGMAVGAALAMGASGAMARDIVDTAAGAGQFRTLLAAAQAAGLVGTLKSDGPLTVFAPTDAAFAKLPKGTVENLLKPANRADLRRLLSYHVVSGRVTSDQLVGRRTSARTVVGANVHIDGRNGVRVNKSRVVTADVGADNGVIHIIDRVLIPPRH
jgi:uncharacterized surface protein with fasciclin (FAS1) repeats